ncbi:hypothetical protein SPRG_13603 [Saprolegnia parasitica CBS 223.65]|uniref:Uncharacterized protein n=1 Tax=Saprolegnia parasitica (strain CBS 223.65) TaxID=695850 RepID=A0A067C187_SAPPC|nr:hypothetical protein SPRG_13603 [Saprolegnia parasitica CBS 223.65]KDO20572.1 hypothetical protein SPRG_13603 [Saprolegnia parasitica CBS 223.65]|eukprot:XP_012208698.1 hypothetical protein SPRG_13603 [Saprolegnia parasitica CBS 223.65]
MWQPVVVGIFLALVLLGAVLLLLRQRASPAPPCVCYPTRYPKVLLGVRCMSLVFYTAVIIAQFIEAGMVAEYVYYTFWNFNLQAIYFGWAIVASIVGSVDSHRRNTLFDVIFANSFLIAGVFWGVLYSPIYSVTWLHMSQHGINSVLLVLEFGLNELRIQPRSMVYASMLLPDVFGAFAWVVRECWVDDWVYPFLDVTKDVALLWYIGMLLGHCAFFGLAMGLSKLKAHWLRHAPPVSSPWLDAPLNDEEKDQPLRLV